jgi:hypothetical protein
LGTTFGTVFATTLGGAFASTFGAVFLAATFVLATATAGRGGTAFFAFAGGVFGAALALFTALFGVERGARAPACFRFTLFAAFFFTAIRIK